MSHVTTYSDLNMEVSIQYSDRKTEVSLHVTRNGDVQCSLDRIIVMCSEGYYWSF